MSQDEADTLPPLQQPDPLELLSDELERSQDPNVRLLAMIGTRLVYLGQMIVDTRQEMRDGMKELEQRQTASAKWRREIIERIETLENPSPRNGSSP